MGAAARLAPHFRRLQVVSYIGDEPGRGLVLSRSERYLENAEKCQRRADVADGAGTKHLYEVMAKHWRQLAEGADRTDEAIAPLLDKIRHIQALRKIGKTEGTIRKVKVALEGALATEKQAQMDVQEGKPKPASTISVTKADSPQPFKLPPLVIDPRYVKPIPPDSKIVHLAQTGNPLREIAKYLGISVGKVQRIIARTKPAQAAKTPKAA